MASQVLARRQLNREKSSSLSDLLQDHTFTGLNLVHQLTSRYLQLSQSSVSDREVSPPSAAILSPTSLYKLASPPIVIIDRTPSQHVSAPAQFQVGTVQSAGLQEGQPPANIVSNLRGIFEKNAGVNLTALRSSLQQQAIMQRHFSAPQSVAPASTQQFSPRASSVTSEDLGDVIEVRSEPDRETGEVEVSERRRTVRELLLAFSNRESQRPVASPLEKTSPVLPSAARLNHRSRSVENQPVTAMAQPRRSVPHFSVNPREHTRSQQEETKPASEAPPIPVRPSNLTGYIKQRDQSPSTYKLPNVQTDSTPQPPPKPERSRGLLQTVTKPQQHVTVTTTPVKEVISMPLIKSMDPVLAKATETSTSHATKNFEGATVVTGRTSESEFSVRIVSNALVDEHAQPQAAARQVKVARETPYEEGTHISYQVEQRGTTQHTAPLVQLTNAPKAISFLRDEPDDVTSDTEDTTAEEFRTEMVVHWSEKASDSSASELSDDDETTYAIGGVSDDETELDPLHLSLEVPSVEDEPSPPPPLPAFSTNPSQISPVLSQTGEIHQTVGRIKLQRNIGGGSNSKVEVIGGGCVGAKSSLLNKEKDRSHQKLYFLNESITHHYEVESPLASPLPVDFDPLSDFQHSDLGDWQVSQLSHVSVSLESLSLLRSQPSDSCSASDPAPAHDAVAVPPPPPPPPSLPANWTSLSANSTDVLF